MPDPARVPLRDEVRLAAAGFLDGLLADPDDAAGALARADWRDTETIRLHRQDPVSSAAEIPLMRGARHEPVQAVKIA